MPHAASYRSAPRTARVRVTRGCRGGVAGRRGRWGECGAVVGTRDERRQCGIQNRNSYRAIRALAAPAHLSRRTCSTCLFYHILALHVPLLVPNESASHADSRPIQPLACHGAGTLSHHSQRTRQIWKRVDAWARPLRPHGTSTSAEEEGGKEAAGGGGRRRERTKERRLGDCGPGGG